MKLRFAFVVGCYRSGTTLVERIVASHPAATGLGFETALFTHVLPDGRLPAFNEEKWRETLQRHLRVGSWQEVAGDREAAFAAIAGDLARERGASVFVEKTPFHLFHVDRILAQDPHAKVLHVVRDGRDVVTSVLANEYPLGRWRSRRLRLLAACALWEQFVWEGHRLARWAGERFHTLRYEDVVRAPRTALERIAGFLELDRSDATLASWLDRTGAIGSNSSFMPLHGISDAAVRRWRTDGLRAGEAELVDYLLAPALEALGYEVAGARPAPLRAFPALAGKRLFTLVRIAQFRENTGFAPTGMQVRRLLRPSS